MGRIYGQTRKIGGDITQSLLYAAFALVVLMGSLTLYNAVQLNNAKQEAVKVMTAATQSVRQLYKDKNYSELTMQQIVNSGVIPSSALTGTPPNQRILLAYGGVVEIVPTFLNDGFSAFVVFNNSSWRGRALCRFLSSGPRGQMLDGPMGSDYSLDIEHCNDQSFPSFNVLYGLQSNYTP